MTTIDRPEGFMDSRKLVLSQTAIVAIGQALGVGAMFGVFALLEMFDRAVLLGGILGAVVSILNFFFMAIAACIAADKAVAQDVQGGKNTVQSSFALRMIVMFIVFFAGAKSGLCNVFAMVIPLVFVRPTLTVAEFFRKSGET